MKSKVRKECKEDFEQVYQLYLSAFGQKNEADLVNALRISAGFIPDLSLVAEVDQSIVGHILFTRIEIRDATNQIHETLALAPMAVLPAFQKKGIGSALVRFGLLRAGELHYKSAIVLGHKHFYPRFGFVPASRWKIKAPFDVEDEVFMAMELSDAGLNGISGTVIYPQEFYDFG
ncbi:MAG: N-acetyltransferase [Saprospiraceae bacterium]|nr:N-acetyltransferase [Saprospiraceae bacterium]